MTTEKSTTKEFDFKGEHFKVEYRTDRPVYYGRDKSPKHMRAYAWLPDSLQVPETELEELAKELGLDSIYTGRGDFPAMDKAWDKHNKLEVQAMTTLLFVGFEALKDERLDALKYMKPKYSRKAGCSCGCSPGFIIEGRPGNETIYINRFNADEEAAQKAKWKAEAEAKLLKSQEAVANITVGTLTQAQCDKILEAIK